MKILVYSSVFYPAIGGIENHTLFLVREFVDQGHQFKLVTEQTQDPNKPLDAIEVVHASDKWRQLQLFFWSDLVYMPNITLKGVWLFAFNPFKKWVISHNDFHLMYSNDLKTKFKNFLIKRASGNISVSQSVADFLKVPSKVIYNCYNNDLFKLYPDELRVYDFAFVGRLVSQKGCELLIDACAEIELNYTLNIIGDGFEMEALKAKVSQLGLNLKIHFLGFKQNEDLARLLNQHHTMIVPSLDVEGFGIVALEGMACGCHMIVSNAGGLSEAVANHGDVFPMGDKNKLKELLLNRLNSQTKFVESESKNNYLIDHSKKSVAIKYLDFFKQIINNR
ncbi:MAG: glycosyltransferase family 4 protein [Bacteroidia bacterium]|nr:glycosyltransferase family 4 protein [Bacteroidia bacterium]